MNRRTLFKLLPAFAAAPLLPKIEPQDEAIIFYRQPYVPSEVVASALDTDFYQIPDWAMKWQKHLETEQDFLLKLKDV